MLTAHDRVQAWDGALEAVTHHLLHNTAGAGCEEKAAISLPYKNHI